MFSGFTALADTFNRNFAGLETSQPPIIQGAIDQSRTRHRVVVVGDGKFPSDVIFGYLQVSSRPKGMCGLTYRPVFRKDSSGGI